MRSLSFLFYLLVADSFPYFHRKINKIKVVSVKTNSNEFGPILILYVLILSAFYLIVFYCELSHRKESHVEISSIIVDNLYMYTNTTEYINDNRSFLLL